MNIDNEEIFFVEYEQNPDKSLIYAPLRSYLALTSKENVELLIDSSTEFRKSIMKKLKSRYLIDMHEVLIRIRNQAPDLSLPITDNCNLRCIYCHASAGDEHKQKTMSQSMIDAALAAYIKKLPSETKHIKIHFFGGGEPTFKLDRFKYAIRQVDTLCQDKGLTCSFLMATNGCYGDHVRELIIEKFKEVSLSFDGPAHIQNYHRPMANGADSYEMVYETARYFYKTKFPFGVRATISNYSLNYMNEIVDFFSANFPNIRLSLEPVTPAGRALQREDIYIDSGRFGEAMVDAFRYASGKPITLVNSAASEYDKIRPVFCSCVGVPHMTISIDCQVVCCARDHAPKELRVGTFDEENAEILIDIEKVNALRDFNVFNYKECRDCFVKYHCAGDCPDRRLNKKVDCNAIRSMGKYILNKKINVT